jgi:hypothetical protein
MTGIKTHLPKGTKIEIGKIKLPDPTLKMPKPAQYKAKTKKTFRPVRRTA